MSELSVMYLSDNILSGTINITFSIGNQLRVIKFDGNKLEGKVPQTLINLTTKALDIELPRVLTTNIIIDLSRNRFEGHIPSIIGDLVGFRTLNLSDNRLEGHIPASLHQLSVLESLDLSSKKISGEIPQ
uniref:Leucine-rich repeat-containing N-terminal plant-type domain-containing protein n=1 Tax=Solanum lycopersicum TaxID=4081 RepID=K4AU25_SOLLC